MIKVGFIQAFADHGWLGGTSYYRNLFSAIRELPERKIDPIVITSGRSVEALKNQFPNAAVVHLPLLDAPPVLGKARRALQLLSGRDFPMERSLRSGGISILSHSGYLGKYSSIPSIAWIPDFQELTFPDFFSPKERAARRRNAVNTCRHASTLLLSSEAALSDLHKIGARKFEAAVFPFVSSVPSASEFLSGEQLRVRYAVGDKFFHLPNQFWIHKNHVMVLEALLLLREQGKSFEVVATGNTIDPRQPGHFESLMTSARKFGVDGLFKPLGVVPYRDLMSFMRHAVAVINPSKFEGWSTTVEEAKSMGKAILLSDIPVHREQAPDRASYFSPGSASELAERMSQAWDAWEPKQESQFVDRAAVKLPERRRDFASRYQQIVLDTLTRHKIRRTLSGQ